MTEPFLIRTVVVTLIAAIIVILLTLAARAQTPYINILPPIKYDFPYAGELTIDTAKDSTEVQALCQLRTQRVACSYASQRWCRIIKISDDALLKMGWNPLHILRHEHAHCNGWSNDHEGMRPHSVQDDALWRRTFDVRGLYRSDTIQKVRQ